MAITRGQFQDVIYDRWVDKCSPTRHFFARLGLCSHKGKYVKTTMAKDLRKIFHEEYKKQGTWIVEEDDVSNSVMTKEQIEQMIKWMRSR